MNTEKSGNLQKTIAVIIIAAIALFFICATVVRGFNDSSDTNPDTNDGDQAPNDTENPDTDETDKTQTENNNTQNKPNEENTDTSLVPDAEKIKYFSYLTGLEIEEDKYSYKPIVYLYENGSALYGASASELLIELPLENGETRYAVYLSYTDELGKIGPIAPTRAYISDACKLFGGVILANGTDDSVEYSDKDALLHLDLSLENSSYAYKENIRYYYTSADLTKAFIEKERIDMLPIKSPSIPFNFSEDFVIGNTSAEVILIPFSSTNTTTLIYDKTLAKYKLSKNGKEQYDMLNGASITYDNAYVLFADTVTYEMSDGLETVTKTNDEGNGYYFSCGKMIEFRWSCKTSGELVFTDLNGNTLKSNTGNSYIAYYKSSDIKSVSFE